MIKPGIPEFRSEFQVEFFHVFTSLRRAVALAGLMFGVIC